MDVKGFVPAAMLAIGNSIVTRAGPSLAVSSIAKQDQPQTVYNFEVEQFHTYFVGKSGLWVHNTQCYHAITPPTYRGGLRENMGAAPVHMTNPQAHHELPWTFREWFADAPRGLDVNDAQFGTWVEGGGSPDQHQGFTQAYQNAWSRFMADNPLATRDQVLEYLNHLRNSGLFY